jgi:hypothetical protein
MHCSPLLVDPYGGDKGSAPNRDRPGSHECSLATGTYTLFHVQSGKFAVLSGDGFILGRSGTESNASLERQASEISRNTPTRLNRLEQWNITQLSNGLYTIQDQQHKRYACSVSTPWEGQPVLWRETPGQWRIKDYIGNCFV